MKKKKYLVYLDILGFEYRPRELAEEKKIPEDVVRQNLFTVPLETKLNAIAEKGMLSRGTGVLKGSDNYVVVVDKIQTAFEVIGELVQLEYIPFEIGAGAQEFDEPTDIDIKNRKEVIAFLKDDIINPYKRYCKNKRGNSIKETFLLFTEEVFNDLEPLDKKYCEKIFHEKTFYVVDIKRILQRCKVLV